MFSVEDHATWPTTRPISHINDKDHCDIILAAARKRLVYQRLGRVTHQR